MRKLAVGALASIVLLVLGYSGAWFYGASRIKGGIAEYADTLKQRNDASDFSYQSIEVSGFPGIYHIVIDKPVLAEKGEVSQNLSTEKLQMSVDLWNNRYTVVPVGKLLLNIGEAEEQKHLQVEYKKEPLVQFELKSLASWKKFSEGGKFADEVQEFRYTDGGFQVVDTKTGVAIMHTEPAMIEMRTLTGEGNKYSSNVIFTLQKVDFSEDYKKMLNIPGAIQAKASIMLEGITTEGEHEKGNKGIAGSDFETAEITVHECNIQSGDISASLQGRVNASVRRFMPEGELSFNVKEMPKLLDYLLSIQVIKDKDKAMAALKQMAEVEEPKDANPQNMNFVIKGNMTSITIGKLDMSQVVLLFRTFL